MIKHSKKLLVGALMVASFAGLAACGQSPSLQSQAMSMIANPNFPLAPGAQSSDQPGMVPAGLAQKLNLSDDQKSQLNAIAQKYRPQLQPADNSPFLAQLKAEVLAPQVDASALKSALQAHIAQFNSKADIRLAMLGEMRGVLTDAQRAQLVQILQQAPQEHGMGDWMKGMHEKMQAHFLADLNLTPDQQAKHEALATKFKALHNGGHEQIRQAFADFVQSGDGSALKTAVGAQVAQLPLDEAVDFVASLDLNQRTTLVDKISHVAQMIHKFHGHA